MTVSVLITVSRQTVTVKVLDWVNPACVPVSGKSVFMLPLVLSAGQGVKELL